MAKRPQRVATTEPVGVTDETAQSPYRLDAQVGFLLRRAHQRASAIFAQHFREAGLGPVQFAALVRIRDEGRVSQNYLGRLTHMDPATIMGVVNRLATRGLIRRIVDPNDRRLTVLGITSTGLKIVEECEQLGLNVSEETLSPLDGAERDTFLTLLAKLT